MTATPRIDRLIAPPHADVTLGGNVLRLRPGADMGETPLIAPNPPGMDLLREMATDMREMRDDVGEVKIAFAKLDGADLPGQVTALRAELTLAKADHSKLVGEVAAIVQAGKPMAFVGGELVKGLIHAALPAAMATLGVLWAMGQARH